MCAINRISPEPPAHRDCAVYSAKVCPFLATPQMVRREGGLPENRIDPAGMAIPRNPGVALVWVTRTYARVRALGGAPGHLYHLGEPTGLHWYAQGRDATRAEVLASMDSGLPILRAACERDADPAESRAALDRDHDRALTLIPPDCP